MSDQHLTAFLTKARKTWRSYQEDANVNLTNNVPLPKGSWMFPLFSHSGNFTSGLNEYNLSTQYNYAAKHNPQIFFRDTNGGCPASASTLYPPLQQLALDLQSDTVADYTLDHAESVQRPAQRARRRVWSLHSGQRPKQHRAGRQLSGQDRGIDHVITRLPGRWRDRALVG
jgi:hypothetical protein